MSGSGAARPGQSGWQVHSRERTASGRGPGAGGSAALPGMRVDDTACRCARHVATQSLQSRAASTQQPGDRHQHQHNSAAAGSTARLASLAACRQAPTACATQSRCTLLSTATPIHTAPLPCCRPDTNTIFVFNPLTLVPGSKQPQAPGSL
jgi:hypothetical protein